MSSDALDIIRQELNRYPGAKKQTSSDIVIQCPFHSENTPSCGVYIVQNGAYPVGMFFCLGCGEKGLWNKLAAKANLRTIKDGAFKTSSTTKDEAEQKKLRERLLPSRLGKVEMPYGIEFDDDEWRSISGDLVRAVGGQLGFDETMKIAALFLPVNVNGKLVTYVKAALRKKKGSLSYVVAGGAIKDKGLFPYDYIVRMLNSGDYAYLVIVEGPRDALYLIDHGIPAIAILGTRLWGDKKRRLIIRLCNAYGVTPLIMMDADAPDKQGKKAGQDAQKNILASFKAVNYEVTSIPLEKYAKGLKLKELDPASLPLKLVKRIRRLVRK